MELHLLRHTPVEVGPGVCYGRTDVGLAPDWERDVEQTLAKLPRLAPDAVFTSPARRCRRLAEALSEAPEVDPRLSEFDFGEWEGQRWEDIPRAAIDRWSRDVADTRVPGGESLREVHARAVSFLSERLRDRPGRVVVVSHGGVLRCLIAEILGLDLANATRLQVDYGSVSTAQFSTGGAPRLTALNR